MYIHGYILNLVLTKSNNDNISNVHTTDAFSDHFSISFTINLSTPRSHTDAVSFRKYHKIDKEKTKTDLLASELINNPSKEGDSLYKQYHSTLSTLIDKHAPPLHAKAKYIPGWVNETVIAVKETKRLNASGAETNLPSIDPNMCRKSTSTIESACRPNLNSLEQKSRTIAITHKN